jgi:CheY-like chemotaxis protein
MYHVLLIEDEGPVLRLLEEMLSRFGYQVQTAFGGREGLRLFDRGFYDLVITDIVMPDLDGHEVARYIRKSDKPHTPIIAISGTPLFLGGDQFDHVLAKPFPLKSLIGAVEGLVSPAFPSHAAAHTGSVTA